METACVKDATELASAKPLNKTARKDRHGLNDRQRHFAEKIEEGQTATAAYFSSFPRCKSPSTAQQEGSKLLKNPMVCEYVQKLREADAAKLASERIASKEETLIFLTKVIRTPAGQIGRNDPLCQRFKDVVSDTSTTFEVRMPDKLRAIERICKIMGWDAAAKVEDVSKPPPPSPEDLTKARATLRKWINFAPRAEDFVGSEVE